MANYRNTHIICLMKVKFSILVVITFLIFSCSKYADSEFEYHVTLDNIQDSLCMADIIDSVKYIKLETTDVRRVGNVRQTIVKNDRIYILSDGVFCFDMKGKFIFSINKKGHSRNEYIAINNMNIIDDTIYLYDNVLNKVLAFDSSNGEYVGNTRFSSGVAAVYGLKDMFVIDCHSMHYGDMKNDDRFLLCPQKDIHDIKKSYFSDSEYKLIVDGTTSVNDRGIIVSSYLGLKAWKISSEGCVPFMEITIPDKWQLSKSAIVKSINNLVLPSTETTENKIYGLSNVFETVNHIVGNLQYGNNFLYFINNKKNNQTVFYNTITDVEPWHILPLNFSSSDGKCLYHVVCSDDISMIRSVCGTGNKPTGRDLNNYEIFCATEECDNPVVAQFFLK